LEGNIPVGLAIVFCSCILLWINMILYVLHRTWKGWRQKKCTWTNIVCYFSQDTKMRKLVTLVIPVIVSVSAAVPATYNIFQVAIWDPSGSTGWLKWLPL
jgi:hypothetical protein